MKTIFFALLMLGFMLILVAPAAAALRTDQYQVISINAPPGDCFTFQTPATPDVILLAYKRFTPLIIAEIAELTRPAEMLICRYIAITISPMDAPARNGVLLNLHELLSLNYDINNYIPTSIFINYRGNSY